MPILTRRSVLRGSAALVTAATLARPYIANAQAKTAELWWAQGFVQEEDISIMKIVADYAKARWTKRTSKPTPSSPRLRSSRNYEKPKTKSRTRS